MFPTAPPLGTAELPAEAAFWMPKISELDEEGFGFFRNTWTITDVSARAARELIEDERRLAEALDDLTTSAEHFDRLARAAEANDLDEAELTADEYRVLDDVIYPEVAPLDGLEVGVAGLVYALASVRILPAASCRGQHATSSWADAPVVYFAVTKFRARALQPLAARTGCTFLIDGNRPELLIVRGESIANTMALATEILENRVHFVQRRATQPRPRRNTEQYTLF